MKVNKYIIISIIILILGIGIVILHNQGPLLPNAGDGTTNNATAVREVIANNSDDPGTVEVIRNIGNPNGKKIAIVVGVHPLENLTHKTILKLLPTIENLNYSYDIYIINVTENIGNYGDGYSDVDDPGRKNGQNLAYKYVYPEIVNGDYVLAVDIHSNIGAYPYKTFVFSPLTEGAGEKYASDVASKCENITYYTPESTTSGPYLTIPLNEHGIPAFYYEEYSFSTQDVKDMHMLELIHAIDSLDIK